MERSDRKKLLNKVLQAVLPFLLGAAILIWVYRDFNFQRVGEVLDDGLQYGWILLSLVFGVLANVFRGWRWTLSLEPLGEYPKRSNCVYAIFISYAANLIVPRVGEVSRCGVLAKYDGVSFPKALGTVVSERLVDTLCIGLIAGCTLLLQAPVFASFFQETGTNVEQYAKVLTSVHFYIIIVCVVAILLLVFFLIRNVTVFAKLKGIIKNVWTGIIALKDVKNVSLYLIYTIGIWGSYFLEFYLTFYAFGFSAHLGVITGLVMFVVGSIAVIVPTPNGAGPWHFAIITMMILYGVGREDAAIFALLVHGIQTFLLILLGIYGLLALSLTNKIK